MELPELQSARERLIVELPDYVRLDDAIGRFALALADEKLTDCDGLDALDSLDHCILKENVAIAIATGMQAMREALRPPAPEDSSVPGM
jgi:hypothetical protein